MSRHRDENNQGGVLTGVCTVGMVVCMPNQPKTKGRNFRISDELYAAAQAEAERRGETVTDAINRALRRYVARAPKIDA